MEATQKNCTLCLKGINKYFEGIEKSASNLLFFPKLNMDDRTKYLVCNICSEKMCAALNFKSTCLDIENTINTYGDDNSENRLPVNLQEIYVKEKENGKLINPFNDKICRLCMKLISGAYFAFPELEKDVVLLYIPEVNFNITKDPVICKSCFDSLHTHSGFVKSCMDVAEKPKHSYDTISISSQLEGLSNDLPIKTENIQVKFEEIEEERKEWFIKTEEIEIKSEEKEQGGYLSQDMKLNDYCCVKRKRNHKSKLCVNDDSEIPQLRCTSCNFSSQYRYQLRRHMLIHKDFSETKCYECDLCTYKARQQIKLKVHMLTHKYPSKIKWNECDSCDYKSRYKWNLKEHMLTHKDLSEIEWHQCHFCEFKSKYRCSLKLHMLLHKNPSEIQWYQCDSCDYKSKHKYHLTNHSLIHKPPSEIKWYDCDLCDYRSKKNSNLKKHRLTHKNPSQIKCYKCDLCDYRSKQKNHLDIHSLTHQNPS